MRSEIKYTLITALLIALSFLMRLDFWPWYQKFGFYQGDIWYFFTYYGDQIQNSFFFSFDYPIGYVLILKATASLSRLFGHFNYQNFLFANALFIIPTTAICTWLLYQIARLVKLDSSKLIFYFVLSPSLFIYSTINYDIFPTFFTLLSIYLLLNKRNNLSAVSLGLATVIKLYPALFLPVMIFYLLNQRVSLLKIGSFLVTFFMILFIFNLPFALTDWQAWTYPYLHQLTNPERNDPTTLSYYLTFIGLESFRTVFWIIIILLSWMVSFIFYKARKLSSENLIYLLLFTAISIVIGNHVYTPQYFLWFLPYISLIHKPALWIWVPFDYLNASTRFFYFKLKGDWSEIFQVTHTISIIFFVCLYFFLLYTIKLRFRNDKN